MLMGMRIATTHGAPDGGERQRSAQQGRQLELRGLPGCCHDVRPREQCGPECACGATTCTARPHTESAQILRQRHPRKPPPSPFVFPDALHVQPLGLFSRRNVWAYGSVDSAVFSSLHPPPCCRFNIPSTPMSSFRPRRCSTSASQAPGEFECERSVVCSLLGAAPVHESAHDDIGMGCDNEQ